MGSQDKKLKWNKRFIDSFLNAIAGIKEAISRERNMKIHLVTALVVVVLAIVLSLPILHLLVLLIIISLVISFELMNTAIERLVDLATEEFHPLAKAAKDLAAGAVFVMAITAVVIGIILFYKPLLSLF